MLRANVIPYTLRFAFTARTSREVFNEKRTYFIEVFDEDKPDIRGIGEIAVFPSLQPSFTDFGDFESQLCEIKDNIDQYYQGKELPQNTAIRFGVETAFADLENGGKKLCYPLEQLEKLHTGIPINGLIWMAGISEMIEQIQTKIKQGFSCLKLKIGTNDFKAEISLLENIRSFFPPNQLTVRLDANGAFHDGDVMSKLEKLSRFDIHSIEQPLPRDSKFNAFVCRHSPIPIALDEDMIERWWCKEKKAEWLQNIGPSYIIIKPSLIGGFRIADEWIEIARDLNIGWWATSALESNIGLNAITQWLSQYPEALTMPQGLGTGQIYTNNVEAPIELRGERMYMKL